jgi:tetratricopeptide (TPR) repeat protein
LAALLGIQITDQDVVIPSMPAERLTTVGVMLDAYHNDNLDEEALRITTAFLQKYPDKTVALRNHARALNKTERAEESFEYYQKAMDAPDADETSANWYAGKLVSDGRIVEAILAYLVSCRLDPDKATDYVNIASQLAFGIRERITGHIKHAPGLPDDIESSMVDSFVNAAFSCPTISTDTVQRARTAMERVESDPSLIDQLIELRRGASVDGDLRLFARAERVRLVRSFTEKLSQM